MGIEVEGGKERGTESVQVGVAYHQAFPKPGSQRQNSRRSSC